MNDTIQKSAKKTTGKYAMINRKVGGVMRFFVNALTFSRLLVSPALLFFEPRSAYFLLIYAYCGLSDVLDGWLARKWGIQSNLGAQLDSTADLAFFTISLIIWIPRIHVADWIVGWVIGILVFRCISVIVAYNKFQQLVPFLHTNLNKFSGLLLFFIPVIVFFPESIYVHYGMIGSLGVCSLATIEELTILLLNKKYLRDIPSIFHVHVDDE